MYSNAILPWPHAHSIDYHTPIFSTWFHRKQSSNEEVQSWEVVLVDQRQSGE